MSKFEDLSPDGPDWIVRELRNLRAELNELRSARSAESTTVGRDGLTITGDGYIRMVDDNGDLILYFGPDAFGRQILQLRREGGKYVLLTDYHVGSGNQFWAMTDLEGRVLVSDDAAAGKGMGRPWLPVWLSPLFVPVSPTAGNVNVWSIDTAQLAGEPVLWEGRATISHPWIQVTGVWGNASGSGAITYKLKVNDAVVGTWTGVDANMLQGPFDVRNQVGLDWAKIQVTALKTAGTGGVYCHVLGCYLTQTQG